MMSNEDNLDKPIHAVQQFWDERARQTMDDCAKVDTSQRTQRMRFEIFLQLHNINGKSLLDVGCGVGDLWQHLKRRGIQCDYWGTDISPEMIRRCQERFPEAHFEVQNILTWEPNRHFDYVVAIAIHNIKVDNGWQILKQTTQRQFELCRIATHLSLLTDRYQGFAEQIQPWRVEKVLEFALSITPYVVLRHDYMPHDFSITLYREPLIDTNPKLLSD